MIRVADYIMKRLAEEGVRHLFYVPGGQCVYLTDALRRSQEIEAIAMHHEQAAAMAALAYAKYNNHFGAALVTTGCAGTNTLTGVLHAWQDSVPMIVISGQQSYHLTIKASGLPLRQVGVQEADIESIVKPITKYAITVTAPENVAYELDKAIYIATHGRKGPTWLDVPLDIQNAIIDETIVKRYCESVEDKESDKYDSFSRIVMMLKSSKRPVLLAGQGVRSADAVHELGKVAERAKLPVVFSRLSYDLMQFSNPYNFGIVSGLAGASRYANFIIQNSDLVLSVGCRLSVDTTGTDVDAFAREARICVIDIDEVEHKKSGVRIDEILYMDAKEFLERLYKEIDFEIDQPWIEKCDHWKQVFSYPENKEVKERQLDLKCVMAQISNQAPKHTVFVSDAGLTGAAAPATIRVKEGTRIIHSFAQGEMGFSLPGACGIAAMHNGPVVAFSGDGSFMMNLQELQTLVRNGFNIKIVLINNNGYSGVRHGQKAHFRGKSIGTDPSNGLTLPSYGKICEAFGIKHILVTNMEEMKSAIRDTIFADNEPLFVEFICDADQFDLHNGLVEYGKRKYGFRPIEDQSPYLEREIFFSEMIVAPMETSYGKPI